MVAPVRKGDDGGALAQVSERGEHLAVELAVLVAAAPVEEDEQRARLSSDAGRKHDADGKAFPHGLAGDRQVDDSGAVLVDRIGDMPDDEPRGDTDEDERPKREHAAAPDHAAPVLGRGHGSVFRSRRVVSRSCTGRLRRRGQCPAQATSAPLSRLWWQ